MHPAPPQSQSDILQAFRKAGFNSLTPLQERLIPLILKGKDVLAEAAPGAGRTTGFVLPLILGLRGSGLAPKALILVPSLEDVAKVTRAVGRFTRSLRDAPLYIPLGELEDTRREQRRLEKGAALVAGTADRVIDHIRRGSLDTRQLDTVVVEEPRGDTRADFVKDVQFIFARLSARRQTVLFSTAAPGETDELAELLHHPVSLDAAQPGLRSSREPELLVFGTGGPDKAEALARIIVGRRLSSVLVFCSPRTDARRIAETLRRRHLRPLTAGPAPRARSPRGGDERARMLAALSAGEADVLIAPSPAAGSPGDVEGFTPSHLVYFDLHPGAVGAPGGSFMPRSGLGPSVGIALAETGQEKELSRLEEVLGVKMKREELPNDDDVVTGSIDRILQVIRGGQDRDELLRLRSRIRRQVPLLQRPLFMAYLLRAQLPPGRPAAAPPAPGAPRREAPAVPAAAAAPAPRGQRGRFGRSIESPRPEKAAVRIGGQDFTQLFVSVGRNRRVFARELTELFTEKLQLGTQELGSVRVFDKYSFVDIAPSRAEEAIAKLSGSEVKGRTITVNYAKKKEEKGER